MNKTEIVIICICYHNHEEIFNFAKEIFSQENSQNVGLVIVDNGGGALIQNELEKNGYPMKQIHFYTPLKNLGYYGGASWGLGEYLKEFSLPEWVIVCNTDIKFLTTGFFTKLTQYYQNSQPAIIAPKIISETSGLYQNPHMKKRPTSLRMHFYKWIFRYYPTFLAYIILYYSKHFFYSHTKSIKKSYLETINDNIPCKIYAPHGSFVIFHRSYFHSGGNLQYSVFMTGEEIYIAEMARKLNLSIIYDPRLAILHKVHSTTSLLNLRTRASYLRTASAYLADIFF